MIKKISNRNLLRPVGAQLQPGVLQVKVFRAEDVPRSKEIR